MGGGEHDRQRAPIRAAALGQGPLAQLIVSIGLTETKRLGRFTPRQRGVLADELEAKACG